MYFLSCFGVLLRQLRRLYTSGSIFQVPPVYNYSTCCTDCVLTRSIHRVRVYAFGVPTRLRVWCIPKTLASQGGGLLVYRPRSIPQQNRQLLPSKRAYDTIHISCPQTRLACTIKLVQTIMEYGEFEIETIPITSILALFCIYLYYYTKFLSITF